MNGRLRAFALSWEPSGEPLESDVLVVEPTGAEHRVRCTFQGDQVVIYGNERAMLELRERYGREPFVQVVRDAAWDVLGR